MRVMYWNCTTPSSAGNSFSAAKLAAIKDRVAKVQPDLLCLDEVSAKVADADAWAVANINSAGLTYKIGALIENDGAHLNTAAFYKQPAAGGSPFTFDKGIPSATWNSDLTKRDLIKVKWGSAAIWFLHANASSGGGAKALSLACKNVGANKAWAFFGDFNTKCANAEGGTSSTPALSPYTFSQWTTEETPALGSGTRVGLIDIPGSQVKMCRPNGSGFIDFGVFNPDGLSLTAVNALQDASPETLRVMMLNGDHFPIAYDVTTK